MANYGGNSVTELDASDRLGGPDHRRCGSGPVGISSDGTHVWVTNTRRQHGDRARRLDRLGGPDHRRGQRIPFAVSSDGTHVWVANSGDNTVTELRDSMSGGKGSNGGAVVQTIGVGNDRLRRILRRHATSGWRTSKTTR